MKLMVGIERLDIYLQETRLQEFKNSIEMKLYTSFYCNVTYTIIMPLVYKKNRLQNTHDKINLI